MCVEIFEDCKDLVNYINKWFIHKDQVVQIVHDKDKIYLYYYDKRFAK